MPILRAFAALARRASIVVDDRQFCPTSSVERLVPADCGCRIASQYWSSLDQAHHNFRRRPAVLLRYVKNPGLGRVIMPAEIECPRSKDRLEGAA